MRMYRMMKYAMMVLLALGVATDQQNSKTAPSKDKKTDTKGASDASAGKGAADRTKSGHKVILDDKKDTVRTPKDSAAGQEKAR
jgi:hypothetical protein